MADQPVGMTFTLGYKAPVDQDYATYQARKKDEEWQRALAEEQAQLAAEAGPAAAPATPAPTPTPGAPGAAPAPEKPSAIKAGIEAGAMASADAVRNMADGLRAVFGMGPSAAVAKALNVPAKKEGEGPPANPIEGAKQILMNGLLQFGFSPLTGTFAGARQALANSAPEVEQTALASGFAAAGIRGVLEGKSYASLTPEEQKRYLSPLTVGEVLETLGPEMLPLAPMAARPIAKGVKKAGQAIKEQAPTIMGERGSIGPEPSPPAGGPPPPPIEPLPGGPPGTHVNLNRIGTSDQVKAVIADLNRAQAEKLAKHRETKHHGRTQIRSRGELSLEQALALDWETTVLTAEEGLAVRDLYNHAAEYLEDLQFKATQGDVAAMDRAYPATVVAGRLALLDEAIGRNIARSLEARSIESKARRAKYDPKELGIFAQAIESATELDGATFLKRLEELRTKEQKRGFFMQTVQAVRLGYHALETIWVHNLLTNPVTHAANVGGTTLATLAEIPERYTAEIIHQIFSSDPKGVQRGETAAALHGLVEGVYTDGFRFAAKAAKTGEDPFQGRGEVERGRRRIRAETYGWDPNTTHGRYVDVMGSVLDNMPAYWALRVEDAMLKGINYRMEIKALAVREARAEGLTGRAYRERVTQLEVNPTADMILAAEDAALLRTLNAELGPVGRAFTTVVNHVPGGRLVVPFVRTPGNDIKWWGQRVPVLNLLSYNNWHDITVKGGAAREKAIARQVLGSAAGAAVAWQVFQGNITGPGPKDPNLKRDLKALGIEPFSIKVGDEYYSSLRLGTVGAFIGVVATFSELMSQVPYDEWDESLVDAVIIAGGETMSNRTSLLGLSNVLEAITNPDRHSRSVMKGFARSVVPAGVRQFTRTQLDDRAILDAQSLMDQVSAGVPGWSDDIPAMLNPSTGETVRFPAGWGPDMISPILMSKRSDDVVLAEIAKHHISVPYVPKAMKGSEPKQGPSIAPEDPRVGVMLSGRQRYRWSVLMSREIKDGDGRTLHQRLTDLVTSDDYKNLSDGPRGDKARIFLDTVNIWEKLAAKALREEDEKLDEAVRARQRLRIEIRLPLDNPETKSEPAPLTPAVRKRLEGMPQRQAPVLGR